MCVRVSLSVDLCVLHFCSQLTQYGMDKEVGQVAFDMPERGEMVLEKPYAQATAKLIDERARALVEKAYKATTDLLLEKKDEVIKVCVVKSSTWLVHHHTVDLICFTQNFVHFIKWCGSQIHLKFSEVALLGLLYSLK